MNYCKRCVYPANAKPAILFDEQGVCSGCRLIESRPKVDWESREKQLKAILEEYRARQRAKKNPYDCIVPVSGGKDSTFQVWLLKRKFNINPLLISYNHTFNTVLGNRNLRNLVEKLDCNHVRFTTAPGSAIRLAKYMLKKVGDITWHYHAGIMTFPIQAAVRYDVPLIVWGEEGFSELIGMHNQDDLVEFTKKKRQEHSMRGFEPEDLLKEPDCPVTEYDLEPFFYPAEEKIEAVGVRGIYLSNFISWNARKQTEFIIREVGFATAAQRERTFNLYDKLDDIHANGLHDYLKYLKFGYGRATDDASTEIRHGRMTREEGIDAVLRYDHVRPSDMDIFLKAANMEERELMEWVEPHRDLSVWQKTKSGGWQVQDHVGNHRRDPGCAEVALPLVSGEARGFIPAEAKDPELVDASGRQVRYAIM
ncbi:MAG: N-acetyl sugar amidotransferase [Verrucomicrobia bacterium]|nr:N-acetyl sugar amidotransferase [Verrucomicrobiota bacterium]NBU68047.1 N-acetyl sugar amidotransferase [Verrucomicrobiota bacterium]